MEGLGSSLGDVPDLTVREVAASVGLSYHAVLRAVHRGEVRAYKMCGRVRFRKEDVLAWIEACQVELETPASGPASPPPERGSKEALRELERRFFAEDGAGE